LSTVFLAPTEPRDSDLKNQIRHPLGMRAASSGFTVMDFTESWGHRSRERVEKKINEV
jgi:hypothetical protein